MKRPRRMSTWPMPRSIKTTRTLKQAQTNMDYTVITSPVQGHDHRSPREHRPDRRGLAQRSELVSDRARPEAIANLGQRQRGRHRPYSRRPGCDVHGRCLRRPGVQGKSAASAAQCHDEPKRRDVHGRRRHRQFRRNAVALRHGHDRIRRRQARQRAHGAQCRVAMAAGGTAVGLRRARCPRRFGERPCQAGGRSGAARAGNHKPEKTSSIAARCGSSTANGCGRSKSRSASPTR